MDLKKVDIIPPKWFSCHPAWNCLVDSSYENIYRRPQPCTCIMVLGEFQKDHATCKADIKRELTKDFFRNGLAI